MENNTYIRESFFNVGKVYSLLSFLSVCGVYFLSWIFFNWNNFELPSLFYQFGNLGGFLFFATLLILIQIPFAISGIIYNIWYMNKTGLDYGYRYLNRVCECKEKNRQCKNPIIMKKDFGMKVNSNNLIKCGKFKEQIASIKKIKF